MIIDLSHLSDGDILELKHDYDAVEQDLNFDDAKFITPIHLQANAVITGEALHVKGCLMGAREYICARCTNQFEINEKIDVDLFFDVKNKQRFDITYDIRELVVFAKPAKILCSPDCKGLCPGCGADKNIDTCSCKNTKIDDEQTSQKKSCFADLEKWINKKKEK